MLKNFHPIKDMIDSAKAQHEVDRANFAAAKAESKARFERARTNGSIGAHKEAQKKQREEAITAANERIANANAGDREARAQR